MKILMFSVKNFAGISEASVSPGKVTIFAGGNRVGKTSLIRAIRAALEGADPIEIRKGSDKAEILIDLEEIKIDRRITPGGQRVKVTNAEGFSRPAPQAYLSSLLGTIQFNPMEFYRAKKVDRTKMLLEAVGQTVTAEDIIESCGEVVPGMPVKGPALAMYGIAHKHYYALRHGKNKELVHAREMAKAAHEKVPKGYEPDPDFNAKQDALLQDRENLRNRIARLEAEKQSADRAEKTRARIGVEQEGLAVSFAGKMQLATAITYSDADARKAIGLVSELEEKLAIAKKNKDHIVNERQRRMRLEEEAAILDDRMKKNLEAIEELPEKFDESTLEAAKNEMVNLSNVAADLEEEKTRRAMRADAVRAGVDLKALQQGADSLDEKVILFRDVLPAKSLAEAKLPIEGLRIEGDDITVSGIPIDNRSGSERMQLSLAIARALAEDCPLKLICVDGIEQLDEESLAAFEQEAAGDDFQYFGTRVGKPRAGEIEIREGKVVAG